MSPDLDVAVVGAGIAGLALAHRLRSGGRSVHVFEAADHVGGRTRSVRRDGYLLDTGAEMIGTHGYPATWRLIRDLGLSDVDAPLIGRDIAMWREGRAHPHVGDPRGLLDGAGLSPRARLSLARLLATAGVRKRAFDVDRPEATPLGARTVAEQLRGYHPDVHDYLFQPLTSGFFGWDSARAAAGPVLSHLLAVGATRTFRTFRDGMDTLARALAERVEVSTGIAVREVATRTGAARLVTDGTALTARTVVLCVPAPVAAALHADAPEYVRACEFRPMVKVICLLDRPLAPVGGGPSYAIAVPAVENPVLAGVLIDDRKHPDRVPAGRGLATLVAGPAADLVDAGDDQVVDVLVRQGERYLPGLTSACRSAVVARFRHGLPMPTAPALSARAEFVRRPVTPVEYAGDWYLLRPSSEGAVRSAELVADRVLAAARRPVAVSRG
ncbi:protoporphyrinogen/coproporphyrinogen oxidase [Actinokineospora sp.]|uniref:protoporphyrinogen/coproporphyrinogen oxidase n=1 Tax=Actinokineospora sp. TaxID=1872133 RepID=UPI0040383DEB